MTIWDFIDRNPWWSFAALLLVALVLDAALTNRARVKAFEAAVKRKEASAKP